jgi:regulatory protein
MPSRRSRPSRSPRLPESGKVETGPTVQESGQSGSARALELAYRFINQRERSEAEVRRRLERAELGSEEVDAAIAELTELGYLDDTRFARIFTEDKRSLEAWGNDRIARTLGERGIDRDLIAAALSAGQEESEHDRAVALLDQRFPAPPADRKERERALGVLLRKGYDSEVALDAVRAWASGDRE